MTPGGGWHMREDFACFCRSTTALLLAVLVFMIMPLRICAQRQVVDRVVAVVGTQIITLSDIRIEKTMREVLGESPPKDERDLLDELIDQRLIRAELDQYPGAEPTEAELDEQFGQIKDFKGLPAETVREAVREHLRVQRFFSERLGRFTSVSEAEIQKYYEEVFEPAARSGGSTAIPPLNEVREDVRRRVADEKTTAELRHWLDHARRIARIEIFFD
jgi:hypothetical protein